MQRGRLLPIRSVYIGCKKAPERTNAYEVEGVQQRQHTSTGGITTSGLARQTTGRQPFPMSGISSLVVDCPQRNISFQQRETMYTKENSTEWKQPLTPHSHGVQLELAQDPHIVKCMQGIHVRLLNPCSEGWQGRGEVTTSCPQQANHQACFSNTHLTRADVAGTYLMAESTQSVTHDGGVCTDSESIWDPIFIRHIRSPYLTQPAISHALGFVGALVVRRSVQPFRERGKERS
ncbi:hypothetical protein NEUTE2DRAFT_69646 [Neurospora tetrasperma FGSC 2509]|nr:hypothetical protein NEUTE2DRAFT_69646 [Neurospora tetrasperma FGSC 2509]